ncbi:MAG: hypothetical protein QNL62_15510 [Gammaproteobacteria bacterium]|nr:hypothetical protein [Gammaproteobacteria bacterium]
MKFIPICLILFLSYSNSAYSEWTDSLKEGWDKSKQYSQNGWDSTKNAWDSTSAMFSESEETRQKSFNV